MPDDSYLTDLLKRNMACDQEAMISVPGFKSVRVFPYSQEAFPYLINRLGPKTPAPSPEDMYEATRNIIKRLVVGHVTEGFTGQVNDKLADWLVLIEDYYRHNTLLTSADYPDEPEYILSEGVALGPDTGLAFFMNAGIGVTQIGVELTMQVPIIRENF